MPGQANQKGQKTQVNSIKDERGLLQWIPAISSVAEKASNTYIGKVYKSWKPRKKIDQFLCMTYQIKFREHKVSSDP